MATYDFDDEQLPQAKSDAAGGHGGDDTTGASAPARNASKTRWIVLAIAVLAAAGAGAWWLAAPHSAADLIARADAAEAEYLAEKPGLTPEKAAAAAAKVRGGWAKVFDGGFPATDEQAIAARRRLAEFERFEGDPARQRRWLDEIVEQFPGHDEAKTAAGEVVDSLLAEAAEQSGPPALDLFEQALERCERFAETFAADPDLARDFEARACRILDDRIAEPPIRAIRRLESFLDDYASGRHVDEMLYRLARRHQMIGELARAEELYTRLIEEFPQSPYLRRAELARAEVVGELDPERGQELWRELAEKYADDPEIRERARRKSEQLAERAERRRQDEAAEKAERAMRSSSQGRYGSGGGPGDTGFGRPIPPREMLADFIAQKLDAVHYAMSLVIEPEAHSLTNTGRLTLVNEGDEKNDFLLMLSSGMEIRALSFDGVEVQFKRPTGRPGVNGVVQVLLNAPWPSGASGELAFEMQAVTHPLGMPESLPQETLDSMGRLDARPHPRPHPRPGPQAAAMLAEIDEDDPFGDKAAAESAAEDDEDAMEDEDLVGGLLGSETDIMLQINQTGYSLSGAAWYPVTMVGDLFTAEIEVSLPDDCEASFSGRRERYELEAGRRVGRWVCEQPMFALYFAYGPFKVHRRDFGDIVISVLLAEDCEDKAKDFLDAAEGILSFHVSRFGPYPYSKLDIVQADLPPIIGGLGPAGMMLLHSSAVRDMDHVPVNLMAHELSHHWWGNLVPINLIDGRYSQWLSEGFATYSDALYTEHNLGVEAFDQRLLEMARLYLLAADSGRELAVMKTFMGQNPFYRHVVYEKGALVLHALRYTLGDDKFFALLKDYAARYAFTPSTVDDFVALAAEATGENMDWFFNEWLEIPGCPLFDPPTWTCTAIEKADATQAAGAGDAQAGGASSAADSPEGNFAVEITLTQPDRLSATPIEVFLHGGEGQGSVQRFKPAARTTTLRFETDFEVEQVTLDDALRVLHLRSDQQGSWSPSRSASDTF